MENTSEDHLAHVSLLEEKHGPDRTREILTKKRHNVIFYPNMAMQELNPISVLFARLPPIVPRFSFTP